MSQKPDVKKVSPEISVVILAYRSGEGIHSFIESMVQSLEKNEPDWEIIIVANHFVDDGDPTPRIVNDIAQYHPRIQNANYHYKYCARRDREFQWTG